MRFKNLNDAIFFSFNKGNSIKKKMEKCSNLNKFDVFYNDLKLTLLTKYSSDESIKKVLEHLEKVCSLFEAS